MGTILIASVIMAACYPIAGCRNSKSNQSANSNKKTEFLNKPVLFRGKQFTTVVPGGWIVSFPDENTRYQIGKLGNGKGGTYKAVIRLDVGEPKDDLAATATGFATQFDLKVTDNNFKWGGQESILLEGAPKGILKPQLIILTVRFDKLLILSVSREQDIDVRPELDYLLKNWQWDEK